MRSATKTARSSRRSSALRQVSGHWPGRGSLSGARALRGLGRWAHDAVRAATPRRGGAGSLRNDAAPTPRAARTPTSRSIPSTGTPFALSRTRPSTKRSTTSERFGSGRSGSRCPKRAGEAGRAASRRAAGASGGVPRSARARPPVSRRKSAPAVLRLGPRSRAPLRHRRGARRRGHERQLRRPRARRALRRARRDRVVPVDLRFPRGSHRSPSHRHFDGESHGALRGAQRPERRHPPQGTARPGGSSRRPTRRRRPTIRSREPPRSWDWEARDFAGFR